MKAAFAALAHGTAVVPPRTAFPVGELGTSLLMGGYLPGEGGRGHRLVRDELQHPGVPRRGPRSGHSRERARQLHARDAEVGAATVGRARVVVDTLESALAEAGDLVLAERAGHTRRDGSTELGAIASGRAPGRVSDEEVTFFKSVGHAVQDVAAAARALRAARERGLAHAASFESGNR